MLLFESDAADEHRLAYVRSRSHVFALAINRLMGWPVSIETAAGKSFLRPDGTSVPAVVHAFAIDPENDIAYDVFGARACEDIADELDVTYDRSPGPVYEVYSEEEVRTLCGGVDTMEDDGDGWPLPDFDEHEIQEAMDAVAHCFPALVAQPALSMSPL